MMTSHGLLDLYLIPWSRHLFKNLGQVMPSTTTVFSNYRWAVWEVEGMLFHLGKALPLIH